MNFGDAFQNLRALVLSSIVFLLFFGSAAQAQSVRLLGDFNEWSAYATSDSAGKLCFAVTKPQSTDPSIDDLGLAYLYITHRPAENIRNELNLVSGYTFGSESTATVVIGSQKFSLFTEADAGWLENTAISSDVAGYMRAGSSMSVEGTSDRGIKVKQAFSLSGVTAASRAIDKECS
jgi:hypothetical protein